MAIFTRKLAKGWTTLLCSSVPGAIHSHFNALHLEDDTFRQQDTILNLAIDDIIVAICGIRCTAIHQVRLESLVAPTPGV